MAKLLELVLLAKVEHIAFNRKNGQETFVCCSGFLQDFRMEHMARQGRNDFRHWNVIRQKSARKISPYTMIDPDHSPPGLYLQGMLCVQADIERQCMRAFTQENSNREFLLVFASHSLIDFKADVRLNCTSVSRARITETRTM